MKSPVSPIVQSCVKSVAGLVSAIVAIVLNNRITADGNNRITADGNNRVSPE